jgi:adenosylcobinamide kinase/adenosylcobinamide-phosphate guanylyltransferase
MGKITLILGGARSGKSRYALNLAKKESRRKVAFLATCEPLDNEMRRRINSHQKSRPAHWQTFEAPGAISIALKKIAGRFDCVLIDCLTLFVSNLLLKKIKPRAIEDEVNKFLMLLKKKRAESIIVSNELGLGIVPANKLGRDFRDVAGRVNQMVASKADRVFFMVSGIPWRIK